ncbi:MAG: hypothetical protein KZQ85_07180 [Candidatus Thiodiazotropha sp. (ex Myrtea sp. 'scaly one' KF741663)]|nr:hypothetical protein [Candidatus Thiodiazotropha sp. (ex Myrtea sp. 'scaly one' KF741663)]
MIRSTSREWMMDKRVLVALVLMAALLLVAYRIYFTEDTVVVQPWYEGQDITEGDAPIPFNAQLRGKLVYPERDDNGELPSDVYRVYIESAATDYFELTLLTAASQALFENHHPSIEQLRNSVATYRECSGAEEGADGDFAILRYRPELRLCHPLFFKREQGLWRLDFANMRDAIQHNHRNYWHFSNGVPPATYAFAFEGWSFDSNGYPIIE